MRGLFLKDIFAVRQLFKGVAILFLFYVAMAVFSGSYGFIIFSMVFLGSSVFFQVFNSDKAADWDRYIYAMPISRRLAVATRYIFGCFIIVGSILFGSLVTLLIYFKKNMGNTEELWMMIFVGIIVLCIMMAVLFPLLYFFGVEKGRMAFVAVCVSAFIILTGIMKLYNPQIEMQFELSQLSLGLGLILAVALFSLLLSSYCSMKIVEKKSK